MSRVLVISNDRSALAGPVMPPEVSARCSVSRKSLEDIVVVHVCRS